MQIVAIRTECKRSIGAFFEEGSYSGFEIRPTDWQEPRQYILADRIFSQDAFKYHFVIMNHSFDEPLKRKTGKLLKCCISKMECGDCSLQSDCKRASKK